MRAPRAGRHGARHRVQPDPGGAGAQPSRAQGFEYLHVVDLDGAFAGKPVNAHGGRGDARRRSPCRCSSAAASAISTTVEAWLDKGVTRVIIGTAAVRDPALVRRPRQQFPGRVAVGLDARDGKVAVEGWAETSELTALEIAQRFEDAGVAAIIYHRHRPRRPAEGPQLDATIALADAISIPVIASGGLASIDDIKALLEPRAKKLEGAIAGRALYDGRLDPAEALALIRRARSGVGVMMFKVRVIPCLDVKDGRVVKGVNFVDLRDAGDPVEAAIAYDAAGADELSFLDITASHENRGTMLDVVRRTAEACFMPLTVGGGVRTVDDIRALLRSGADKVSINTAAVQRPRIRQGGGGEVRRPVHRGRDRRQAVSRAGRAGALGNLHPWRPQAAPGSTRSNMRRKWWRSAPAKSC